MEKHQVLIIGAGEIGLSLGKVLRPKNYQLHFWDKDPKVLALLGGETVALPELVSLSDTVLLCVPSWALREALLFITPYLPKKTLVLSVTKGVEAASLATVDKLLSSLLPKGQPFGLLSGMMIAEELREGGFGAGVIATTTQTVAKRVMDLFAGTNLNLESSSDLRGVALGGVLKNVYAVAVGISYGLDLGENVRGFLLVQALREMKKIILALGGRAETALGLAGLGDLVATGFSANSKNHTAGLALAQGPSSITSEGVVSLPSIIIMLGGKIQKYPLLSALNTIVAGDQTAAQAFAALLTGKIKK